MPATRDDVAFAMPGDSGALVYGALGAHVGMVWGGMRNTANRAEADAEFEGVDMSNACFFTPLDAVLESLSAVVEAEYGKGNFSLSLVA